MTGKILVTGAGGRVGALVVRELVGAGAEVRAGARTPQRLSVPEGVEVVAADLTRPETLPDALKDVSSIFLYAVPDGAGAVAEAAAAAGVEHVVLLSSHTSLEVQSIPERAPLAAMHETVEDAVTAAGLEYTFLRPANFASNVLLWGWDSMIRADGVVRFPYPDSHSDAIHERDIAAVAATVLTSADRAHRGASYSITGPESVSQREQADLIGRAIGRPVRFEEVTPQDARRALGEHVPDWVLDATLAYWAATDGIPYAVNDLVASITGRPALTFGRWAIDHRDDFTPS
ncbi:NAD(P)H-binding protein [Kineosporia sp. NBRC 101731]|uniref:NAD(P)H-binding protein n=1 Tax=Kineosporia sp. NBRC 101731 TaxID=3032199 RepID=UPI00249FC5D6|nr:NAD(P)H-binding protein [Kineosporia sp. NBRC 101731]GLY32330.1 nucleotide-diphosphate-sugar epimerase [Kineosporia sp. NBRC 101731]